MRCAGYVLVGGRSRRMGQDKALLPFRGRTLAGWIAEEVRAAAGTVTLIGDPARFHHLGLPILPDLQPGLGPLAGIETALSGTPAEWNLIVACDLPGVTRDLFSTLLTAAEAAGKDVLIPRHADGGCEPLCAVYHARVLTAVRGALSSNCLKLKDMCTSLDVAWWVVPTAGAFQNVNTPEEWSSLQQQHG